MSRDHSRTFASVLGRPWSSTVVWLVVILILVDAVIANCRPLRYVDANHYVLFDKNPLGAKIPAYFNSSSAPDVLLVGSSLPMTAIGYYDFSIDPKQIADPSGDELRTYIHARYLERLLSNKAGRPVTAFNLTCIGCMASDTWLLVSEAVNRGKVPRMVLYGIAPRDFMDNHVAGAGRSYVFKKFADWRILLTSSAKYFSGDEARDLLIGTLWHFFKVRSDYNVLLSTKACESLGRPLSLSASVQQQCAGGPGRARTKLAALAGEDLPGDRQSRIERDLAIYKPRYAPFNPARFDEELEHFRKLLELCREKQIQAVVFNMPITDRNKDLIPDEFRNRFRSEVLTLPSRYGAAFVDLDSTGAFSPEDFVDSVHTNASGGKKVQDLLLSGLDHIKL